MFKAHVCFARTCSFKRNNEALLSTVTIFVNYSKSSEPREIKLPNHRSRYIAKQYLSNISQTPSEAFFSYSFSLYNYVFVLLPLGVRYTFLSYFLRNGGSKGTRQPRIPKPNKSSCSTWEQASVRRLLPCHNC